MNAWEHQERLGVDWELTRNRMESTKLHFRNLPDQHFGRVVALDRGIQVVLWSFVCFASRFCMLYTLYHRAASISMKDSSADGRQVRPTSIRVSSSTQWEYSVNQIPGRLSPTPRLGGSSAHAHAPML